MNRYLIILFIAALLIAGVLSWFASSSPDGLERIAEDLGFAGKAGGSAFSLMPDYTVPGVKGFWSNALAGIIGVCATFGVIYVVGKVITHRRNRM